MVQAQNQTCIPMEQNQRPKHKTPNFSHLIFDKDVKKYVFIVGGSSIYEQFLPYCERAYVTKVYQTFIADTYIKNLDKDYHWKLIEQQPMQEENGMKYAFLTYENQQYQQNAVKKKIV